jgi:hypothetical protein
MITDEEWQKAKPLVERALENSGRTHTAAQVYRELRENRAELWMFGDSMAITSVIEWPNRRDLHIWLAAGNLDDMQRGLPFLDQMARDWGCGRITLNGRKGWERVLTEYRPQQIQLVREIDKG